MKKLIYLLIAGLISLVIFTSCEDTFVEPIVEDVENIDEPTSNQYSEALVSADGSFYLNDELLYVEEYLLYNNVDGNGGLKSAMSYSDTTYSDTTYIYYVWDGIDNIEFPVDIDTIGVDYVGWTIWMCYTAYYHEMDSIVFEEYFEVIWEMGDAEVIEYTPDTIFHSTDNILERNYILLEVTGDNNEILNVFDYRIKRDPFDSIPLVSINIVSYELDTDTNLDTINLDNVETYSLVWMHHFDREYIIDGATIMVKDYDWGGEDFTEQLNIRYVSLDVLAFETNNKYFRFNLIDESGLKSTDEDEDLILFDIDYNGLSVGELDYDSFEYENMDGDRIKELYKFAARNNLVKEEQGNIFGILN